MAAISQRSVDWVTSNANQKVKSLWGYRGQSRREVTYELRAHYHPYVEDLIQTLNRDGLPALLDPVYHASLTRPLAPALYQPGSVVTGDFPSDEIDVSDDGPYAVYNWELFFH